MNALAKSTSHSIENAKEESQKSVEKFAHIFKEWTTLSLRLKRSNIQLSRKSLQELYLRSYYLAATHLGEFWHEYASDTKKIFNRVYSLQQQEKYLQKIDFRKNIRERITQLENTITNNNFSSQEEKDYITNITSLLKNFLQILQTNDIKKITEVSLGNENAFIGNTNISQSGENIFNALNTWHNNPLQWIQFLKENRDAISEGLSLALAEFLRSVGNEAFVEKDPIKEELLTLFKLQDLEKNIWYQLDNNLLEESESYSENYTIDSNIIKVTKKMIDSLLDPKIIQEIQENNNNLKTPEHKELWKRLVLLKSYLWHFGDEKQQKGIEQIIWKLSNSKKDFHRQLGEFMQHDLETEEIETEETEEIQ